MHQAVGNTLQAMASIAPPHGLTSAFQLVDAALANCQFVARSVVSSSLWSSPVGLAFGQDMVLDTPMIADWNLILNHHQQLIDQRLVAANGKRFFHDCQQ